MRKAEEEAISKNNGCRDLSFSTNGLWEKRGHMSLNGISAMALESGNILVIEILYKFHVALNEIIFMKRMLCKLCWN